MTRPLVPRDLVARQMAISPTALVRYETLGLIHVSHKGNVEGYEPSQVRRLWTILSFQRDMGINLAGVEVILRLCDQLSEVHHQLDQLAGELREIIESEESNDRPEPQSRSHSHSHG